MTEREMWGFGIIGVMILFPLIALFSFKIQIREQERKKRENIAVPPAEKKPAVPPDYTAGYMFLFTIGLVIIIFLPDFWSSLLPRQKIGFGILFGMIVFSGISALIFGLQARKKHTKKECDTQKNEKDSDDE